MKDNLLEITAAELFKLEKRKAILLRLTEDEKNSIDATAKILHLTTTEFLTKVAMMAVDRINK